MRDTIRSAKELLEEALDAEDEMEVRYRIRTAIQLLDALEHTLDSIQDLDVFEEMLEENPELQDNLADLGIVEE